MEFHYTNTFLSPLGKIIMASDGSSLTGLWFDGQKYFGENLIADSLAQDLPIFQETKHWLNLYFQKEKPETMPPLRLLGSPFRCSVWEILLTIPYGQVITYGEIARVLASKHGRSSMSAQAVGGAVAHNPISIIIPCHRVIGANGSLTGYAGGIERKIKLLSLEGVDLSHMSTPKQGTAL